VNYVEYLRSKLKVTGFLGGTGNTGHLTD